MSPGGIRRLRTDLGLTQTQFGHLLGVHHLTVWKWEKGRTSPTPHQVAMMRSFEQAQRNQPDIGKIVIGLLVGAGVALAVFVLLRAAFAHRD